MKLPPLPSKPYHLRSLKAHVRQIGDWDFKRGFPCFYCRGQGYTYNPGDRHVVDGYKDATRHPCTACKGSCVGEGHKPLWEAEYQKALSGHVAERMKVKTLRARIKSALAKLTPTEQKALQEYFKR